MAKQKGSAQEIPAADQLIDIVKATMKFFHAQDGRAYALVHREGRNEVYEINTEKYSLLLSRTFYKATGRTIPKTSLDTAVRHLSAFALLDGPKLPVYNRVAPCRGGVAVDLADETWRAIVVTPEGWEIKDGEALFSRDRAQDSLPTPAGGGSIDELREFIPVRDEEDWRLLVVWIVKTYTPRGPYPLLEINGLPGSAKSARTRLLVSLIDPHIGDLQSFPKEERDLLISASHTHLLAFDNVSRLPDDKSDCLCRLATGGGFRIRRLYSDTEETIIDACLPVIVNGINRVCLQQDLIDRAVQITVPPITQEQRLSDEDVLARFTEARPRILGAFMTLLAAALGEIEYVNLSSMPRMADFARLGVAIERVLGWPEGSFLEAYSRSRRESMEESLGSDPVGRAIVSLMRDRGTWRGTAADLLSVLQPLASLQEIKSARWPKSSNWLSQRLDRLTTGLEAAGITVTRHDYLDGMRKVIILTRDGDDTHANQIASADADIDANVKNTENPDSSSVTLAMHANGDTFSAQKEFDLANYIIEG